MLTYGSVCSGIEAASVAWHDLGWTDIPVGKKRASDGPRYKQLGNSMAVPVMHWIGARIADQLSRTIGHNGGPPLDMEDLLG